MSKNHKEALARRVIDLEIQINNNQHDAKLLAELRKEYRELMDELELFYDDEREEEFL